MRCTAVNSSSIMAVSGIVLAVPVHVEDRPQKVILGRCSHNNSNNIHWLMTSLETGESYGWVMENTWQ